MKVGEDCHVKEPCWERTGAPGGYECFLCTVDIIISVCGYRHDQSGRKFPCACTNFKSTATTKACHNVPSFHAASQEFKKLMICVRYEFDAARALQP